MWSTPLNFGDDAPTTFGEISTRRMSDSGEVEFQITLNARKMFVGKMECVRKIAKPGDEIPDATHYAQALNGRSSDYSDAICRIMKIREINTFANKIDPFIPLEAGSYMSDVPTYIFPALKFPPLSPKKSRQLGRFVARDRRYTCTFWSKLRLGLGTY